MSIQPTAFSQQWFYISEYIRENTSLTVTSLILDWVPGTMLLGYKNGNVTNTYLQFIQHKRRCNNRSHHYRLIGSY